jgi:SSS family solute:Na+ symporter
VAGRFPSRALSLLFAAISVAAFIPYLMLQMSGAGIVFSAVTDGHVSFELGAALAYAVVLIYVLAGGVSAVGWTNGSILQLVFWENAALLGWGLGVGTLTALLAMWPHLASTGADVPWGELLVLLTAVLLIGMAAPLAAGREVLRPQILAALRSE